MKKESLVCRKTMRFFLSLVVAFSLSTPLNAESIRADIPTGLLELDGLGNPVYLFVPDQYAVERALPLVISLPDSMEDLEAHIKEWQAVAIRKSLIVLVPYARPREGDAPYRVDEWLIKIKNAIAKRYRIAPDRIYLIGNGKEAAHYASYLGTKYGEEFSAVALLNGSWVGGFSSLIKIPERAQKQVPFFVSFSKEEQGQIPAAKDLATEYIEKGYMLHVEVLEEKELHTDGSFRRRMLAWLEDRNEKMRVIVAESDKNWREKFYKWVERNVKVK